MFHVYFISFSLYKEAEICSNTEQKVFILYLKVRMK